MLPRIHSKGRLHRVKVGETLTLPCKVENLGPYILIWNKGFRVLTAGKVLVKRDRRIAIMGTNLQIAGKYCTYIKVHFISQPFPSSLVGAATAKIALSAARARLE